MTSKTKEKNKNRNKNIYKNKIKEENREKEINKISIGTQTERVENPIILSFTSERYEPKNLLESIKKNWIFFITLLACCYYLSLKTNNTFIQILISVILMSLIGYFVHTISHLVNFKELYENSNNYITNNKYLNSFFLSICSVLDFHDKKHHNTSINKTYTNITYEFLNNIVMQGGLLALLVYCSKWFSVPAFLLWAFLYATVHNINYAFIKPQTHKDHHTDKFSCYGLDIWDIIFNTTYRENDIEIYNHASINLILITLAISYIMCKT